MTNYHVIMKSQELEFFLADGRKKLVGSDQWTDLAVIQPSQYKCYNCRRICKLRHEVEATAIAIDFLEVNSQQRRELSN